MDIRKQMIEKQIELLRQYMRDTDWMVIKCTENGDQMKIVYPEVFIERKKARERINELESKIR